MSYAPELGRYFDFELAVEGAYAESRPSWIISVNRQQRMQPSFKAGLGKIRAGVAQTLDGVISTVMTRGLGDDWRRRRLAALIEMAPKGAKAMLPEDARALRLEAIEVAESLPDPKVKADLQTFADSISPPR